SVGAGDRADVVPEIGTRVSDFADGRGCADGLVHESRGAAVADVRRAGVRAAAVDLKVEPASVGAGHEGLVDLDLRDLRVRDRADDVVADPEWTAPPGRSRGRGDRRLAGVLRSVLILVVEARDRAGVAARVGEVLGEVVRVRVDLLRAGRAVLSGDGRRSEDV